MKDQAHVEGLRFESIEKIDTKYSHLKWLDRKAKCLLLKTRLVDRIFCQKQETVSGIQTGKFKDTETDFYHSQCPRSARPAGSIIPKNR